MKTIKLPLINDLNIDHLIREYNSCMRISYNRYIDGLSEKDIRLLFKHKIYKNINLDSWFTQCAIKDAESYFIKSHKSNNIIKKPIKFNRVNPITMQGEAIQKGNRKFNIDMLNNQIIFKVNRKTHLTINLVSLHKNYKKTLLLLEEAANNRQLPYTIKLDKNYIYISYDENLLYNLNKPILKDNRTFSIDLNPNNLGWSVLEFDHKDNYKIISSGVIDISFYNQSLKVSSDHPLQKYQNNKKIYESYQVSKFLLSQSLHYQCKKFVVEDLNIQTKNHNKGNNFNRLVNNNWNRNKLLSNLESKCNLNGIEFVKINPAYSSFIGNLINDQYPDMISSSIEIGRRGYHQYQKGWFYPKLIDIASLTNRWKEALNWSFNDWKELFDLVKKIPKLTYRNSLSSFNNYKVFRLNNTKSNIKLLCFI